MKKAILLFLVSILAVSCSIQKRQYRSGYYIKWKNFSSNSSNATPEKSTPCVGLKQVELPNIEEPTIKADLIPDREEKLAKNSSLVFTVLATKKVQVEKLHISEIIKKNHSESHKTDLASVGIILLVVSLFLFFLLGFTGARANFSIGQGIVVFSLLLLLAILAILFLIIGLIIRLIKKNKATSSASKS